MRYWFNSEPIQSPWTSVNRKILESDWLSAAFISCLIWLTKSHWYSIKYQLTICQIFSTGSPDFITVRWNLNFKATIVDKSPLDSAATIHIFFFISRFPHKIVHPFQFFLQFALPPPYTKLKHGKKFWIHTSNIDCGVRGGVGPMWIGKRPRAAKCPKTFVHDCSCVNYRPRARVCLLHPVKSTPGNLPPCNSCPIPSKGKLSSWR